MIDPFRLESIERSDDVFRWALFTGVGDPSESLFRRFGENVLELFRWMANLGGIETYADDPVLVRKCLLKCGEGL